MGARCSIIGGLYVLLDLRSRSRDPTGRHRSGEAPGNALVGVVVFQLVEVRRPAWWSGGAPCRARGAGGSVENDVHRFARPAEFRSAPDDRRKIARCAWLVVQCGASRWSSRRSRWRSGSSRSSSTRSSRRWRRTTTSGRWRCGRRAACSSTATAACSSRTATRSTSRSSASTPSDLDRDDPAARAGGRRSTRPRLREIVRRHRASRATGRSRSSRTPRSPRWRRSPRAGSTPSCPTSSSSTCPTRRYPTDALAAHLFGYVGEVTEAQLAASGDLRAGDIVGQAGVEQTYNTPADGAGRRAPRGRQQHGPRDPDARARSRRPRAAACS